MTNVRCRSYRDDGSPVNNGCSRGDQCNFAHPGTPEWIRAARYDPQRVRKGGRSQGFRRPSDSRSGPPSVPSNYDSGWDSSSWGQPGSTSASSNGTFRARDTSEPSSNQGSSNSWSNSTWNSSTRKERSFSSENQENSADLWETRAWGNSSSTKPWANSSWDLNFRDPPLPRVQEDSNGSRGLSTWGSQSPSQPSSSTPWGTTSIEDREPPPSTGQENNSWGTSDWTSTPSTWGHGQSSWSSNINDDVDASGAPASHGTATASDSPSGRPNQLGKERVVSYGGDQSVSEQQVFNRGRSSAADRPAEPNATATKTTSSHRRSRPRSTPPSGSSTCAPGLVEERRTRNLPVQIEAVDMSYSVLGDVPHSADSVQASDVSFRCNSSYGNLLQLILSAIGLQLQLDDARAQEEGWKHAQSSSFYSHASQTTRAKLDNQRVAYKQEVTRLDKRLNEVIRNLSESPHSSACTSSTLKMDIQQVIHYTNEVKQWMKELENYRKLDSFCASDTSQARKSDTWTEVEGKVLGLEEFAGKITDQIQFKNRIILDINFIESKAKAIVEADLMLKGTESKHFETLFSETACEGDKLEGPANLVANLIKKKDQDQESLGLLQFQLSEQLLAQEQISKSFEQFREWKLEDRQQIQQLKQKLQLLHQVTSVSSTLDMKKASPMIQTMVTDALNEDLAHLFEQYQSDCMRNHQIIIADVTKHLQPTVDLTRKLHVKAQEFLKRQLC